MPNKKKQFITKKYKMTAAYALNGHLARTHTHTLENIRTHLQLWVGILIFCEILKMVATHIIIREAL